MKTVSTLCLLSLLWSWNILSCTCFTSTPQTLTRCNSQSHSALGAEKEGFGFNPLKEFSEMISSLDDVIDDFMGKRMGNGEVFYGQRKYKPSGRENTEGDYNGMGMSDKSRIDMARVRKEEYLALKRAREEQRKQN